MTDIYVAYDQTEDAYLPVRLHEGTWTLVHGLEEDTFDDLPALSGKDRYRALADIYSVDRERAVKRATRLLKQRAKHLQQWEGELEEFLAASTVRHARREQELDELRKNSDQFIDAVMRDPSNDRRAKRYIST